MIHPSYVDLMKVVNKDTEEAGDPIVSSRYSIVMATAKRARQIIAGDEPLVRVKDKEKPLSVAVDELSEDKLQILTAEQRAEAMRKADEEEEAARLRAEQEKALAEANESDEEDEEA